MWKPIRTVGILALALYGGTETSSQLPVPSETELAKLLASDGAGSDKFGHSLDLQGDTLLIGAPHHYSPPDGLGSVYIFMRDNAGAWRETVRLFASDGTIPNEFGHDVALDGDTFVAGAPFVENHNGEFMGKVYIFSRDAGGSWREIQQLQPPDVAGGDLFGKSVALDGDTAVASGGGFAYVFRRGSPGTWSLETVLDGLQVQEVALSGQTLILSGSFAPGDFGAMVYVDGPSGWTPEAQLHLPAIDPGDIAFVTVAIDGDTAVIAGRAFFGLIDGAHVFVRGAPGVWTEQSAPLPEDVTGDNFGSSVDISGKRFIVGATHHHDTGAAWVYERDASGNWVPFVKLIPSDAPSNFGFAVTLDGPRPAVGAWADYDIAPFAGSAYVFEDVGAQCPADLNDDGSVGFQDFLILRANWGTPGGDINGDGTTNIQDLRELRDAWGPCAGRSDAS